MKINENKKGISLIVLVITIIIMIILAAAIILSLNSSGVIGKANEAKTVSDEANAKNVITLALAEWKLEGEVGDFSFYAETKLNEAGFETSGHEGFKASSEGGLHTIYIGSDDRQAFIPEGFVVSDIETEDTVTEGLVIYEGEESVKADTDAQTTRNQFVWIPVDIPEGKTFEQVFARTTTYNGTIAAPSKTYTEPYSYDTKITEVNDLTGEYAEHAKIKDSVEKYGGFYVGRYEVGTDVKRTGGISNKYTTAMFVQKEKQPYNMVNWAPSITTATGDSFYNSNSTPYNYGKGAVELSRNFLDTSAIKSHLIYGVEWDAVMMFMNDVQNPTVSGKKYIENSINMGWYSNNYKDGNPEWLTGVDLELDLDSDSVIDIVGSNEVKNIYDMAGNLNEWTMEGYFNHSRAVRGGNATTSYESGQKASYRDLHNLYPHSLVGFRVALYLK